MTPQLSELAIRLRNGGISVATSETIDAARALRCIDLAERSIVKESLRSILVKQPDPGGVFDRCFDIVFRSTGNDSLLESADSSGVSQPMGPTAGRTPIAPQLMDEALLDALLSGDQGELASLAQQAVDMYAGDDESDSSERRLMNRIMRSIDLSRMLSAAMRQVRGGDDLDELEVMLRRNELSEMIELFRRQLAAEIARRLAGRDLLAEIATLPDRVEPGDADLLLLSRSEAEELRRTLQPLLRRMAARIGQRRKLRSSGRLDLRRTVRRSLQTGGVPLDVSLRRRHPHRPDVVVLCDVSGSVSEFAQFTFSLIHALHSEVSRVRSFAFVDGVAEVTDVFEQARYNVAVNRLVERRGVVGLDGHSNYGTAFTQFVAQFLDDAVGSGTTVVVSGDGRSNYRDDGAEAFERIARRARRVYWLNPEAQDLWGETDSAIERYRRSCTSIHEVRTLRQLADAIAELV